MVLLVVLLLLLLRSGLPLLSVKMMAQGSSVMAAVRPCGTAPPSLGVWGCTQTPLCCYGSPDAGGA